MQLLKIIPIKPCSRNRVLELDKTFKHVSDVNSGVDSVNTSS
jgi:predicted CoA-binding protein